MLCVYVCVPASKRKKLTRLSGLSAHPMRVLLTWQLPAGPRRKTKKKGRKRIRVRDKGGAGKEEGE